VIRARHHCKNNFTTEDTEDTKIRKRRIAEHFILNYLLSLLLTSVISVSSVVAFLLLAVESEQRIKMG
jgi:hypothetical protein